MCDKITLQTIQLFQKKGQPPARCESARTRKDGGLTGDRHERAAEHAISITGQDVLHWMQQQPVTGLCFAKFRANLILDRLPECIGQRGDGLAVGSQSLRLTDVGKHCYPADCALCHEKIPCRLRQGILYAIALCEGEIRVGDPVRFFAKSHDETGGAR